VKKRLKDGRLHVVDPDWLRSFFLHWTEELGLKDRRPCGQHTSVGMEQFAGDTERHVCCSSVLQHALKVLLQIRLWNYYVCACNSFRERILYDGQIASDRKAIIVQM
jgi:hypothetical protein